MVEVVCSHCGTTAAVTPDESVCPACREDLQHLLPPDAVVDYFRVRVQEFWTQGDATAALAETERGLTFVESSDLHLLAAILAKQAGRYDLMRSHVAAIPVDDTLRGEAEWLLRSHQDRQRALREAARTQRPVRGYAPPADPSVVRDLLGTPQAGAVPAATRWSRLIGAGISVGLVTVAGALIFASWWWFGPGALPASPAPREEAGNLAPLPTATFTVAPLTETPVVAVDPTDTPAELPLLPTPTPTPAIAPNLVEAPTQESPVLAGSNPRQAVIVSAAPFDLQQFLRDGGHTELAELAVSAYTQDGKLFLQGFVNLDVQRRQLIRLLQAVPGVREVVTVDLLLRPLPTYVVQPGDTLWTIVANIYGDVERLDEFYAFNRESLPSPDALVPGMELRVMPLR